MLGLIGAVLLAVVSTSVWFNSPRLRPSQAVAIVAPPVLVAALSIAGVLVMGRWARRRAWHVEFANASTPLRARRACAADDLPFDARGFAIFFMANERPFVSMPWSGEHTGPGPRLRLLAPAPWPSAIEVAADSIADAQSEQQARERESATRPLYQPVETLNGRLPGAPNGLAVEMQLPLTPPSFRSMAATGLIVTVLSGGAYAWHASLGRAGAHPLAYALAIVLGVVGVCAVGLAARDFVVRWIPERRRIAIDRRAALRELEVLSTPIPNSRLPEICRAVARAHSCTSADLSGLTHDRLSAIEARLGIRLPRVWLVCPPDATRAVAAWSRLPDELPALFKVTRPVPWQDHASTVGVFVVASGLLAFSAAAAGMFSSPPPHYGLVCCAGPAALCWLYFFVVDRRIRASSERSAAALLLTRRGPCLVRGLTERTDERLGPADAYTLFFGGSPYVSLDGEAPEGEDEPDLEHDEPSEKQSLQAMRVRIVAGAPWPGRGGAVEGRPCYHWAEPDDASG